MAELYTTSLFSDANLKAYYRLESGALTTDSKNGFTLTNNNSVGEDMGKYGGAADFGTANTNKSLSIANDLGITGGAITITGWYRPNTDIGNGGVWIFTAQEDSGTSVQYAIEYRRSGATRTLVFRRYRQGIAANEITYNVDLGTTSYRHIVLTYDGTNLRGYLDGSLVAGPTAFSGNGTGVTADSFSIGNQRGLASGNGFYSSIDADDVAVFSRALTADEIGILFRPIGGIFFHNFL
jgi:hypothetical protein